MLEDEYVELPIVNEIRRHVARWREVKGLEREQDRSKEGGARRWVDAVNHWGRLGRWRYAKIHSPHQLESVLAVSPETNAEAKAGDL